MPPYARKERIALGAMLMYGYRFLGDIMFFNIFCGKLQK
jgi:hypothetical protein